MARHRFAGDLTSITLTVGPDGYTILAPSVVRFYDAKTGGAEHTDLTLDSAGTLAIELPLVSASMTDPNHLIGEIPIFYGPTDVWAMWIEGDGGPRQLIIANDLPDHITMALTNAQKAQTAADKAQADATKALAYPTKFVQQGAAATWVIEHNMKTKPSVNVVDYEGNQLFAQVVYPNDNAVVLTFSEPTAGSAYLRG